VLDEAWALPEVVLDEEVLAAVVEVVVEPVDEPLDAVGDVDAVPAYVMAARAPKPPTAATLAMVVPRVSVRRRSTARFRPSVVRRSFVFMAEQCETNSFDSMTGCAPDARRSRNASDRRGTPASGPSDHKDRCQPGDR
jgi:hypothetical protein